MKLQTKGQAFNLFTFFCLYIAQSIPLSFFSAEIPILMRQEKFSLSAIALSNLIRLPFLIKFVWSPFVDKYTRELPNYKRFILVSELIYAIFILIAAVFDFRQDFLTVIFLIMFAFIASATQVIATDALAARSFDHQNKSMVNSMKSMGGFAGAIVGAGVLLLLFTKIGWHYILPCLSLILMLVLIPLLVNKNIKVEPRRKQVKVKKADMIYFFTQKGISKQIIFLILYYAGLAGIFGMLKPFLVDCGYSMKQIGLMDGLFGSVCGLVASFCGGHIIRKMGRHQAQMIFAAIILIITLYFVVLSYIPVCTPLIYLGIALLWSGCGMASIVVYTMAMDCVRPGREGTDITVQIVIMHASGMILTILLGKLADISNYSGMFIAESSLALISLLYVRFGMKNYRLKEISQDK